MCFEYREVSLLFRLCAVGPQRPFTVKSNWVKEDCPFLSFTEAPINQGIHRLSHLCLPARCSGPPRSTLSFYGTNVSINPTEWPPSRLSDRWVRCTLPLGLCGALAAWEGVRGTSF